MKFVSLIVALGCLLQLAIAQNLIQIDNPQSGQSLNSYSPYTMFYTVLGAQTLTPPPAVADYPSSLAVQLQWSLKSDTSNPLLYNISSGMITNSYPGGVQNKQYNYTWTTPNCHFFSRYNPNQYSFSLIYTPQYDQPVTTPQSAMTVPINFSINNATFPRC